MAADFSAPTPLIGLAATLINVRLFMSWPANLGHSLQEREAGPCVEWAPLDVGTRTSTRMESAVERQDAHSQCESVSSEWTFGKMHSQSDRRFLFTLVTLDSRVDMVSFRLTGVMMLEKRLQISAHVERAREPLMLALAESSRSAIQAFYSGKSLERSLLAALGIQWD